MVHRQPVLLAVLLAVLPAVAGGATQGPPAYVYTGAAPSGACIGSRVWIDALGTGTYYCNAGTWAAASAGGGAPTTAQYWTGAADGTLSAEKDLSTFTGLVLNTAGTPSSYPGASCVAGSAVMALSASGVRTCTAQIDRATALAATPSLCAAGQTPLGVLDSGNATGCYQLRLGQLGNPVGDAAFTFGTGNKILWTFTGNTDVAFSIDGDGAFTGTGDLVHIHKSGTGSAAGADALHVEVTSDANMRGVNITMPGATYTALNTNGKITAGGLVSAPSFTATDTTTSRAFTTSPVVDGSITLQDQATAAGSGSWPSSPLVFRSMFNDFPTNPIASATEQFLATSGTAGELTWGATGGAARMKLHTGTGALTLGSGGSLVCTSCITASTAVSATGTPSSTTYLRGDNTWSTPAVGGGADALGRYLVQTATNAPVNAQVMASLGTGLVLNTTTTGVQSIKAANTCTNQFARSDTASGVWTCAGIGVADLTANQGTVTQVLHGNAAGQPAWGAIVTADLPTVAVTKGGTGLTTIAADNLWRATATDTVSATAIGACTGAGKALTYDTAAHTFGCNTIAGAGVGTLSRLTAAWTSSATANTLGIVGTGGVPLTSPTYAASAPFSAICRVAMTRPSAVNQPRYGFQSTGTVTSIESYEVIGLAGTAPARTEALQTTTALATASCAAGCTANVITGGAARKFTDVISVTGVMNATGTLSLVMAPSAAAAHTAAIGSYCVWY